MPEKGFVRFQKNVRRANDLGRRSIAVSKLQSKETRPKGTAVGEKSDIRRQELRLIERWARNVYHLVLDIRHEVKRQRHLSKIRKRLHKLESTAFATLLLCIEL